MLSIIEHNNMPIALRIKNISLSILSCKNQWDFGNFFILICLFKIDVRMNDYLFIWKLLF